MNLLTIRALGRTLSRLLFMAVALFLTARPRDFWEAWVFLPTFWVPELLTIIYLARNDPALLERRLRSGAPAERTRRGNRAIGPRLATSSRCSMAGTAGNVVMSRSRKA